MQTKKIKIGDRVLTPEDGRGIVAEEMPIGEFRIITEDRGEVFLFAEDLNVLRKEAKDGDAA